MLIVKGEAQKSVLANTLMNKTKSICFEYYNMPVVIGSLYLDKSQYSLNDFIECIKEEFEFMRKDDTYYDYVIIYTNENEEDLNELIDCIKKNAWKICHHSVMLMCKG